MASSSVVTRFAPSPTGWLHLGHAASALFAARAASEAGGRFLLRIEDIDPARCRPEFTAGIEQDLAWLGLRWERPVRRQSEHLPDYAAVLMHLRNRGLLYPCFCTRAEIAREVEAAGHAPHTPDGGVLYPGTCRALSQNEQAAKIAAGAAHVFRLDMSRAVAETGPLTWWERDQGKIACRPEAFGDVVLARRDVPASYHLCVTHDDAAQGITLVTRGDDLRTATSVHRVLQVLMGWPEPEYRHHPLTTGADGRRLAKRDGAMALRAMREAGVTREEVLASLGATSAISSPGRSAG